MTDNDHSRKVSDISGILAKNAGYLPGTARLIRQAAHFHDIGKSGIDQKILDKPGKLTSQEYEIIKTHTLLGSQKIAEVVKMLTKAQMIAEQHHEKIDGSGYLGLHGNEIFPYARIVAVADVFDALISKRQYKEGWPIAEVIKYFQSFSGKLFDADLVSVLFEHIEEISDLYRQ
jgi:HD-GYP domain-containing protein (c-di-GMP phosphodiesterase class II)